jgi:molybdopterin converting factor small subunit
MLSSCRNCAGWLASVLVLLLSVDLKAQMEDPVAEVQTQDVGESVPPVNAETVAKLSGLDEPTLEMAGVADRKQAKIQKKLQDFLEQRRAELMTHRAICSEMRERYKNLKASAEENTFDPCRFVTDEALEKTARQVDEARREFQTLCREATGIARKMLSGQKSALIERASSNPRLPAPYRWLDLNKQQRQAARRIVQVHRARQELAEEYPKLRERLSQERVDQRMMEVVDEDEAKRLKRYRQQMADLDEVPEGL